MEILLQLIRSTFELQTANSNSKYQVLKTGSPSLSPGQLVRLAHCNFKEQKNRVFVCVLASWAGCQQFLTGFILIQIWLNLLYTWVERCIVKVVCCGLRTQQSLNLDHLIWTWVTNLPGQQPDVFLYSCTQQNWLCPATNTLNSVIRI